MSASSPGLCSVSALDQVVARAAVAGVDRPAQGALALLDSLRDAELPRRFGGLRLQLAGPRWRDRDRSMSCSRPTSGHLPPSSSSARVRLAHAHGDQLRAGLGRGLGPAAADQRGGELWWQVPRVAFRPLRRRNHALAHGFRELAAAEVALIAQADHDDRGRTRQALRVVGVLAVVREDAIRARLGGRRRWSAFPAARRRSGGPSPAQCPRASPSGSGRS